MILIVLNSITWRFKALQILGFAAYAIVRTSNYTSVFTIGASIVSVFFLGASLRISEIAR